MNVLSNDAHTTQLERVREMTTNQDTDLLDAFNA